MVLDVNPLSLEFHLTSVIEFYNFLFLDIELGWNWE
jgi:hypothetical protein